MAQATMTVPAGLAIPSNAAGRPSALARRRAAAAREQRALHALAFLYFLAIALASWPLPRAWRPEPLGAGRRRWPWAQARALADAFVPFAFQR